MGMKDTCKGRIHGGEGCMGEGCMGRRMYGRGECIGGKDT